MVAFGGLGWRSKTPASRLERSDLSQTTPGSPVEVEVPSVQNIVGQLEAKEEQSRRRSSVGDRPSTPNFRAHPFRPLIPYYRTPSPRTVSRSTPLPNEALAIREEYRRDPKARPNSPDFESKVAPLVLTRAKDESFCQPVSGLSTPSASSGDSLSGSEVQLPPSLPSKFKEFPVTELEKLPPLPESPLASSQSPRMVARKTQGEAEDRIPPASHFVSIQPIAPLSPLNLTLESAAHSPSRANPPNLAENFHLGTLTTLYQVDPSSTVTFNTSVRDLIQEFPDSPIGGGPAAPMDSERTVGTMAVRGNPLLDSSRVTSPPQNTKRPLKIRSNHSESSLGPSNKDEPMKMSHKPFANLERPASPQSVKTMQMVTAPETPRFGKRHDFSDISDVTFDGSPGSVTEVKDFATAAKGTEVDGGDGDGDGGDICPDCDTPTTGSEKRSSPNGSNLPSSGVPGSVPGGPDNGISISGVPASTLPASGVSAPVMRLSSGPTAAGPAPGLPLEDHPSLSGIPGVPEVGGGNDLNVPGVDLTGSLAVPADITGKLDPPKTPPPSKKRMALGKGKKKGQKVIRRGRHLILRKPVLSLVIGRQLAGPTSTALKLVSKGTSVDPTALKEAAVPQAVPQPVPLPA